MPRPAGNLYEFIWAKLTTYTGEQDLKCSGGKLFCSFFHALEIQEGTQKRLRWEKQGGMGLQDVKILYSLEGSHPFKRYSFLYFKGVLT